MYKISCFKKSYNNHILFNFPNMIIDDNDKIGIVGSNGVGKTTLLNILYGISNSDNGIKKLEGNIYYLKQMEYKYKDQSMGQSKKKQIFENDIFNGYYNILLLDEPTNHMDNEGINILINKINKFKGNIFVVSHNTEFIDRTCNKILEIDNSQVNLYCMKYSKYVKIKEEKSDYIVNENKKRKNEIYKLNEIYKFKKAIAEKSHLKSKEKRHDTHRNAKGYYGGIAKKMSRNAEAVKKRIDSIELLEEQNKKQIFFQIDETNKKYKKAFNFVDCYYNDKKNKSVKIDNFYIERGEKILIYGKNGSGKTTFLEKLYESNPNIYGDYSRANDDIYHIPQDLSFPDENIKIVDFLMQYYSNIISLRNDFYNLFFSSDKINQKLNTLSGGEKLKIHLLRVLSNDVGILLLDEPTNNLDINSIEFLKESLKEYNGTLLFVSHDRNFYEEITDKKIKIENNIIKYLDKRVVNSTNEDILVLELRRNDLIYTIGKLKDRGGDIKNLEKNLQEIESKIDEARK